MGALGAENTQLKSNLEETKTESATIAEERDAPKDSATTEPPTLSRPLAKLLRHEKTAREQALQEGQARLYKRRCLRRTRPISS